MMAARAAIIWLQRGDRWIPGLFILFFAALALVEARFIVLSTSTYRGLVTERPYERGIAYDRLLAAERAQVARGWRVTLAYDGIADAATPITVEVRDRQGTPLTGASVTVLAERTTRQAQAIPASLAEDRPGLYRSALRLPVGGPWTLRIVVRKGDDLHRHIEERRVGGSRQP